MCTKRAYSASTCLPRYKSANSAKYLDEVRVRRNYQPAWIDFPFIQWNDTLNCSPNRTPMHAYAHVCAWVEILLKAASDVSDWPIDEIGIVKRIALSRRHGRKLLAQRNGNLGIEFLSRTSWITTGSDFSPARFNTSSEGTCSRKKEVDYIYIYIATGE